MEFCPFHKKDCNELEMITIIELKKGKIKQTKICQECASKYLESVNIMESIPESIKDLMDLFLENKGLIDDCPKCLEENFDDKAITAEQKIKILESKMAAAIKIEDYEAAAMLKKQIKIIRDSN
jgi:protein-arginine kinase activator protein McsA